jgi:hypothetical protein
MKLCILTYLGVALKQMLSLVYVVAGRKNTAQEGEDQWQNEKRRARADCMAR